MANNSIRNRIGLARTFLRWCDRRNLGPGLDLEEEFAVLRRSYPATYGKVQDAHPARWLTEGEAHALIASCSDGTWLGSRDQVAIRLGLLGIRIAEVCRMTWGNVGADGILAWTGKGRHPRSVRIGPTFADRLDRWRKAYEAGLSRSARSEDPILCPFSKGNQYTGLRPIWGQPLGQDAYRRLLQTRADNAGLGHLAPHDLRRTTANLLNTARSADGGHLFDVGDIQKVLGHAQIGTTQRYLNALDTDAIDRAAPVLDLG
jgi:integrase/recombinase XerD